APGRAHFQGARLRRGTHCLTASGIVRLPFFGDATWIGRPPTLGKKERLFVGYSVRNRNFTKSFFRDAAKLAAQEFQGLSVSIFDVPYAYNDSAIRDGGPPQDADFKRSIQIGDERELMVRRAIEPDASSTAVIRRWQELQTSQVTELRSEFRSAVATSESFRDGLLKNATEWLRHRGDSEPEEFLEFQIQEFPVLLDIYYRQGNLV